MEKMIHETLSTHLANDTIGNLGLWSLVELAKKQFPGIDLYSTSYFAPIVMK